MAISNLHDVYIDQLQDLYSACKQSHGMTGKLARASKNGEVADALRDGAHGIRAGMEAAEKLIRGHGAEPGEEFCKGMEGLVKEAQAHVLDAKFVDPDARDAMIITQYQRMVHYGIAGWGCLVAFAGRLGYHEDARELQICLNNTYDGDRRMTAVAKGAVNEAAM